jgi:hypothetical protein
MVKTCTKCGESKPVSEFYVIRSRGKRRADCKDCVVRGHKKPQPSIPAARRRALEQLALNHPAEFVELLDAQLERAT